MKKLAKDIKKGDNLLVAGKKCIVEEIELSDLGKQGKKKARIVLSCDKEKIIVIRPEDYPFDSD